MKSRIRWGRVIAAAFFSELGVIAVLLAITGVYMLIAPGRTSVEYQQFGARVGFYVAPAASGLAAFLCSLWVARRLTANFVAHGTLVGLVAVTLTVGFLFGARPEDRLMYVVSFLLRIAGGYLGGLAAQTRFHRKHTFGAPAAGPAGSLS